MSQRPDDFFASLDRVNRAMQGTSDLHQMMQDVLDVVLSVFGVDRAFLLYPCDPDAASFEVPMERTVPRYPGAFELGVSVPTTPQVCATFAAALDMDGPIGLSTGVEISPDAEPWKTYEIKTLLATALRPRTGKPWMFGLHQCSHARAWNEREKQLFVEIGRRLADGLNTLLMYRDLQQREGLLTSMFENIPDAILVKDAQTLKLVRCNRAAEQLLGYAREGLAGKTNHDLFPKETADRYTAHDRQVLGSRRLHTVPEEVLERSDGQRRLIRTTKVPILDEASVPKYLCIIVEDITERRSLEAQLHQSQKLESIGRLAGGVAHDFNNMLTVIIANTDMALAQVDPGKPLFRRLEDIRQAAGRSAALTHQLLAFARKQTVSPRVLDLNATLNEMIKLLRLLIGSQIELVWNPTPELWAVRIDPSQIDQVLTNLCVNARDAIDGVGTIAIETSNVTLDEAHCARSGAAPGDYVMLRVSDDGRGMDEATRSRIFEPFFTTREVGKGTGLGLAIVYGILSQNGGFIDVESDPGRGTTFKLYLPRQASHSRSSRPEALAANGPTGHETILVVEDEPSILALVGLMLQRLGYRVIAAARPSEALRLVHEHQSELHMIVTDVIMPEMSGPALARQVAELRPGIRCLFMSGYIEDALTHQGLIGENVDLIQKPFSMQSFGARVRSILDSDAYRSPFTA